MLIEENKLRELVTQILQGMGSDRAEAEVVGDHLVRANLSGHDSHGIGMLPHYVRNLEIDRLKPNTQAKTIKDAGNILVFDGQLGYGQRVAKESMQQAIDKAKHHSICLMGLRNAHHIGRIGTYGEQAIDAGVISIHFVNVTDHPPVVAPFAAKQARYVTNPICIAVPGTGKTESILLDFATSRIALGKVRVAMNKGDKLATGMVIDETGSENTNPDIMFETPPKGALMPFGEHKGSGLALMCEILAGVLTGGGSIQPGNNRLGGIINNMMTIVIDPQAMTSQNYVHNEIDALLDYVKSASPVNSDTPVLTAGDPERLSTQDRRTNGIPVDDNTWQQLLDTAKKYGVATSEWV